MQSFNCNNCGAGLQAPRHTQFVTCKYCQSQLAVKQSETAVYTEVIGEIQEAVAEIHENVEVIRLQNELERLDREWDSEKDQYLIASRTGKQEPTASAFIWPGVILILFSLFTFAVTLNSTSKSHDILRQNGKPEILNHFSDRMRNEIEGSVDFSKYKIPKQEANKSESDAEAVGLFLFALVPGIFGMIMIISGANKQSGYREALGKYQKKRQEITKQLKVLEAF